MSARLMENDNTKYRWDTVVTTKKSNMKKKKLIFWYLVWIILNIVSKKEFQDPIFFLLWNKSKQNLNCKGKFV